MKTKPAFSLLALAAAVALPSCITFDDDDDDVRAPVATTTITEETKPVYTPSGQRLGTTTETTETTTVRRY